MQSTGEYLEELTREYWFLSNAWEGRINHCLTTSGAIRFGTSIEESLGPQRALRPKIHKLLDDIVIRGGRNKYSSPSLADIIKFPLPFPKV
jgi:hypothetical protein